MLAALLAAMMLAGCGEIAEEAAGAALSVAEYELAQEVASASDAVTAEDSDASTTEEFTEDEVAAVASSVDDSVAVDPDFTVEASTESDQLGSEEDSSKVTIDGERDNPALVTAPGPQTSTQTIDEDGYYYDKDNVALYLVTYHKLPGNYITKKEAKRLGWEGGPLEPYAHDMAIGGDHFGNYEGTLPEDVEYHECDIDTKGKKRGAKRIIYSENWDIYYTDDHYETFTLLYEGE